MLLAPVPHLCIAAAAAAVCTLFSEPAAAARSMLEQQRCLQWHMHLIVAQILDAPYS
jgi:hypothetical protein